MSKASKKEEPISSADAPLASIHANHDLIVLLEKSKRTSESLIYHLPNLIMIIDRSGRILKGNFQIEEIIKPLGEELLYFPISRLFSNDAWKQFNRHLYEVCASAKPGKTVEFELLTDGINLNVKHYHWKLSLLEGLKSQVPLITVVGHDITEIKKMFREIQESHEKLNCYSEDLKKLIGVIDEQNSQIMESSQLVQLGEMAGGIAQEISHPINALKTHADRMNKAISSEESGADKIEESTLLQSATTITETVDEVSLYWFPVNWTIEIIANQFFLGGSAPK
ncbi:MAG: PAS domain-containing protein, partial [Oligoflexales bacterium]|nr:PAS domain-containing protein [Oligoflexales bacterium]